MRSCVPGLWGESRNRGGTLTQLRKEASPSAEKRNYARNATVCCPVCWHPRQPYSGYSTLQWRLVGRLWQVRTQPSFKRSGDRQSLTTI